MRRTGIRHVCGPSLAVALILLAGPAAAQQSQAAPGAAAQESLAAVGAKLSNPVSDVWALFTEFDMFFSDGDVNRGGAPVGGRMIFQPVLPFSLYGRGDDAWKLITRPAIPVIFSQPVPTGFDEYAHKGGLGDMQLPVLVVPPSGNWLLGLGPTWLLPTSTNNSLGRQQWGVGPAGVIGWKNKDMIAGVFPQYTFGIGSRGDRDAKTPDASYLSLLYFVFYNLPDAWQVGMNPTITYDHTAPSGDRWNVPIGLVVAKTTKVSGIPVKFQLGLEYSVVKQDTFGQVAQLKLNVIPVIPALMKNSIFGGQ